MPDSQYIAAVKATPSLIGLYTIQEVQGVDTAETLDGGTYQLINAPRKDQSGNNNSLRVGSYNTTFIGPFPLSVWDTPNVLVPVPTLKAGMPDAVFIASNYGNNVASEFYEIAQVELPKGTRLEQWSIEFVHAPFANTSTMTRTIASKQWVCGRPLTNSTTNDQFAITFEPGVVATDWRIVVSIGNDAAGTGISLKWHTADWTPDNNFHHYAITCDGTDVKVYRDGVALTMTLVTDQQAAANATIADRKERITACIQPNAPISFFAPVISPAVPVVLPSDPLLLNSGWYNSLAIYERALTPTQVKAHFDLLDVA